MAQKAGKSKIVAFKVEEDLANFLDKLKNKSEFIRKAILAQFGMSCPLCAGSGVVPRGVHNHFKPVIAAHSEPPLRPLRDRPVRPPVGRRPAGGGATAG